MLNRHDDAVPASIQAASLHAPTIPVSPESATPPSRHPLNRQYVLDSERQSENSVFSLERSPIELEIEKGLGSFSTNRSPGWTTRSL